jgi:hypothetical protein
MKTQKLLVIAAIVCLLAVFVSGSAYAQPPLPRIIVAFCQEVDGLALEAGDELGEATRDLAECIDEFQDCRGGRGIGNDPLVECLNDGNRCTSRANNEQQRACDEFRVEFKDAYNDALRQARFNGVGDKFEDFFDTRSGRRQDCLRPAIQASRACAGLND